MEKVWVKGHFRAVPGRKRKVRVKGHWSRPKGSGKS